MSNNFDKKLVIKSTIPAKHDDIYYNFKTILYYIYLYYCTIFLNHLYKFHKILTNMNNFSVKVPGYQECIKSEED